MCTVQHVIVMRFMRFDPKYQLRIFHFYNYFFLQKANHITDFKLSPTLKYVLLIGRRERVRSIPWQLVLAILASTMSLWCLPG